MTVTEDVTKAEKAEEEAFLDEIMKTRVMTKTLSFLRTTNVFTKSEKDFKKLLAQLWFSVYRYY